MLCFIECLRTIAVLLITNSHFDGVYPVNIATGGELGMAVFFMITGYLMANIDHTVPFGKWYTKRILRLYIPVLMVTPFEILLGRVAITSVWDVVYRFVWPTTYWYVGAMAIHYAVFYLFVRAFNAQKKSKSTIVCGFGIGIAFLFAVGYWFVDKTEFNLLTDTVAAQAVWLLCMLVGMLLRTGKEKLVKKHVKKYICTGACSAAGYVAAKYVLGRGWMLGLQCVPILAAVGFSASLFMILMQSEQLLERLLSIRAVGNAVRIVSKNSLEIYVVQQLLVHLLKNIIFPLNFAVICVCILFAGILVHWVSDKINKVILWKTAQCAGK